MNDIRPMELLKNIAFSEPLAVNGLVEYKDGQVVSRTLAQNKYLSMTVFAFDKGEGLSTHSAPADALVHVLDGQAAITVGGKALTVKAGEVVAMPADIPHGVTAEERFKMLLVVVKKTSAQG